MLLLPEADQQRMMTNNAIPATGPDGRTTFTIPFRLGAPRGPVAVAPNAQVQPQPQPQVHVQAPPVSRPVHMPQPIAPRYPQPSAHASSSTAPAADPKAMGPPAVPQPQPAQYAQVNGVLPSTSTSIPQVGIPLPGQQNQVHALSNGTSNRLQLPMSMPGQALTAAYLQQHQQQLQLQAAQAQVQAQAQAQAHPQQQSQVHQQHGPHQSPPQAHVQALHGPGQNGIDTSVPNRQHSASPQKAAAAHHYQQYHTKYQLGGVNGYNGAAMNNSAIVSAAAAASLGQQQPHQFTAAQLAQINNAFAHLSPQDIAALGAGVNTRVLQTYAAQLQQATQQQQQAQLQLVQAQQQAQQQAAQNGGIPSNTFSSAIPNPANMTFKLPSGRQQPMQWPPVSATQVGTNGVGQGVVGVNANGAGVHGNGLEVPNGIQRNTHSPNPYGQAGINGSS